jgi:hypothetical protein
MPSLVLFITVTSPEDEIYESTIEREMQAFT